MRRCTNVSRRIEARGDMPAMVACKLVNAQLGWGHTFPAAACESCEQSAGCRTVQDWVKSAALARIACGQNPAYTVVERASVDTAAGLLCAAAATPDEVASAFKTVLEKRRFTPGRHDRTHDVPGMVDAVAGAMVETFADDGVRVARELVATAVELGLTTADAIEIGDHHGL